MQVVNGRLVVLLAAAGRAGEHFLKTRLRLPLPAADLVRMYFVLARDRLDRAVPRAALSVATLALNCAVNRRRFVAIPLALLMAS